MKLLSINQDSKTKKNTKYGFLTGIMYLDPWKLSGKNVCSHATAGCIKACLNTAGMGVFSNVQQARINRTNLFYSNRELFFNKLVKEINSLITKANKNNLIPNIRLNGTSDLPFENISFVYDGVLYENIFKMFSNIQFYDYTKNPNRIKKINNIDNYNITFSKAENNLNDCITALNNGINVASVFKSYIPKTYYINGVKYKVIDGDLDDLRFKDIKGVIIGLIAKGKAKKDNTGFVIQN